MWKNARFLSAPKLSPDINPCDSDTSDPSAKNHDLRGAKFSPKSFAKLVEHLE